MPGICPSKQYLKGFTMVDFRRHLSRSTSEKSVHPVDIYEKLDRASDKGPLRPVQKSVLQDWDASFRRNKDVILKLNTGQGKTLIGLLMLQARLNEGEGPALYLCPNNFLVQQTYKEATQFGITCVTSDRDLPDEFLESRAIYVTTAHKLFNGLSKFGLGTHYVKVPTLLMDDAHACIEAIRDSCVIRLNSTENAYRDILGLFDHTLKDQGAGTHADILKGERNAFLPVPYWDWDDKHLEVTNILSKNNDNDAIKFAWPLLKDRIQDTLCVISGVGLEISPYLAPLHHFGTYYNARHRIFMSATVADDSFMVKGLGVSETAISMPLTFRDEKWSGEKMVLIPSLIDSSLTRENIVALFAKPKAGRKSGIVVLSPSFENCKDWEAYGSVVARKEDIQEKVKALRDRNCEKTLVIVNRYDGIDLPDDACRILVIDSKPHPETLIDRYIESCRSNSEVVATKIARTIEQGMGRGVRGEKDYCVVLLIGPDLCRTVKSKDTRQFLSAQTQKHVDIGMEVAQLAKEDIVAGVTALDALRELINQCLKRDEYWKDFYVQQMDAVPPGAARPMMLELFAKEASAEKSFHEGRVDEALAITQVHYQ
jgi:replicative superfamily II helicase